MNIQYTGVDAWKQGRTQVHVLLGFIGGSVDGCGRLNTLLVLTQSA
jgi:hypothetical protein